MKLDDGTYVGYQKCLLATGGKPKNLAVIEKAGPEVAEHVTLFRNVRQHDIKLRCCQLAWYMHNRLCLYIVCDIGM